MFLLVTLEVDMHTRNKRSCNLFSGSFDINYYENGKLKKLNLNRSNFGVLIQPKTWRYLDNFSTNAISLHLTDREFSDEDYIRNFKYIK